MNYATRETIIDPVDVLEITMLKKLLNTAVYLNMKIIYIYSGTQ